MAWWARRHRKHWRVDKLVPTCDGPTALLTSDQVPEYRVVKVPSTVGSFMANTMGLFLTRALDIYEATLGGHDIKVARTLDELGLHAFHEKRKEKAATLFARELEIEEAQLDPNDARLAKTRRRLEACSSDSKRTE